LTGSVRRIRRCRASGWSGGTATQLGDALAQYGRIFKTLHILNYIDDEPYRREVKRSATSKKAATTSAGPRSTAAKGSYATATATGWKTVARRRCTRKSESRSRNLVVQFLVLSEPVSPSRFPGDPCVRGAERRLRYGYRERRGCQRPGRSGRGPR
jgi:hypothetical protein